jgi:3-oxoacyl-[acyl-carrier-protein] synthase-1
MNNEVCIIGTGACTAVGLNAESTAAAVRAGISGFEEHPYMINQQGDPYILAMVPSISAEITGAKRYLELLTPALKESLLPLQGISSKTINVMLTLGLPEIRSGIPDDLAGDLSASIQQLEIDNLKITDVRTAHKGHAAGLMAMESAKNSLQSGRCEFCLVGGVDTYIDPDTLDWIEDNEQLHTPDNAWGFIPGEAAGFCLLCSQETAKRYHLPVKTILHSAATAQEKNRIKTKTVCIGEGLTEAVYKAVQNLPEQKQITQVYNDMNGESYRAEEFGFMLARMGKYFADPADFSAPADCWGDVGAATGLLAVNQWISSLEKGYSNGNCSMVWASSEGGERSAVVLSLTNKSAGWEIHG